MRSGDPGGANGKRGLFAAVCLCVAAWPGLAARAEDLVQPGFLITPTLGLQETFTDNALLTAADHRTDYITRGFLDLAAELDHGPATAKFDGLFAYDQYVRTDQLSAWSLDVNGHADYALIRDHLTLEATGSLSDQYASTFGQSAVDRAGAPGRTRIGVYYVGPRLATRLGQLLDLDAAAQVGQVTYAAADHRQAVILPEDASVAHAVIRLDTADHIHTYELVTTAEFDGDDRRYRHGSGVQSLFVRLTPGLRAIARAGYERVYQPGVTDIGAPFLSAGLEFRPNADSRLAVEGGERYHRAAWAADADMRVSDRVRLKARYAESLTPDQFFVANAFTEFAAAKADFAALAVPTSFRLRDNLYNQTSFNKRAELHVTYASAAQAVDLAAEWSDRRFLVSNTHDRTASTTLSLLRRLRPDLDLIASANYTHTFASPLYGPSETYGFDGTLAYRVNSTVDLRGGYHYTRGAQLFRGGEVISENVLLVSIEKRF